MAGLLGSSRRTGMGYLPGEDELRRRYEDPAMKTLLAIAGKKNGLLDLASAQNRPRGGGLFGSASRASLMDGGSFQPAEPDFEPGAMRLPDSTSQPRYPDPGGQQQQIDPRLAEMIGQAPKRNKGSLRDILAGVLAVAGDAFDPQGNGRATEMLAKRWQGRSDDFDARQTAYDNRRRLASMPGATPREMLALMVDPKSWATNMSNAATSRFGAATLNPGDQRYLGDGNGVYQAPTRGQLFAKSLGLPDGSDAYNTAIRDQELGANGPTAFGNQQTILGARNAQQTAMERLRQQGRLGIEGVRQGNRMQVRGAPTYRDLNPRAAPPRKPRSQELTATGPNGQTIYLRGGQWVDAKGNPVR